MSFNVDEVLAQLTLEEKTGLTSGSGFWWTVPIERLGVPRITVSDGPHGLRTQLESADHVGLGESLPATCFPPAAGLASSWNPLLLNRIGQALAREARAYHVSVILGPGINMKRSPLCGRNFEYFSEDPFLAGELGVGIVDGIQSLGVGTSVKHFAANNQEDERQRVDVVADERTLREIYLPAFETVVRRSQPWTVMCSYNRVNGTSASQNAWLLDDLLRKDFGFTGLVVSDWGAVYDRVPALVAGTDLEMPPNARSPQKIVDAVQAGEVSVELLDTRVRTVLELIARGADAAGAEQTVDHDAHHALAREAAAESIVLLHNENDLLPLARGTKVALIGEFARSPRYQGAGSSQVNPTRVDTALDALSEVFDVTFAPGFRLSTAMTGAVDGATGTGDAAADDATLLAEAVQAAREADVAVVMIGLPAAEESEGFDRTHLNLPAGQLAVLSAVAQVNPRVVTVLSNGSTVLLGDVLPHSPGLIEAWLGGQAGGSALADVLVGAVNPSGRLAETIPVRLEDNSSYLNFPGDSLTVRYGEGVFIGYRGYDACRQEVVYPFGFGLSYTTFRLSDLQVSTSGSVADGDLAAIVRVTVTNTGQRDGAEVVQVYVGDVAASVARPPRELKGFTKVSLAAGASQTVEIPLDQRAFSYWSPRLARWVVEAGEFTVEVGHNSRDLPVAQTISIDAPSIAAPLTAWSTLNEWLENPRARELMAQEVAGGQTDPLRDPALALVIGSMPMAGLAAFGGMSLDDDAIARVLAQLDHPTP